MSLNSAIHALEHRQLLAAHIVGSTVVYSTIQAAVDAAPIGGTVTVDAGSYTEKVIISKALTVKGAKAGVDARSGTRGGSAESVVTGILSSGVHTTSFYVNANNVTIDGFTVQGETSQNSTVGAGVVITANHAGTHIVNNIIQNNVAGLFLSNNSSTSAALIQYNLFKSNNNPGTNGGRGIYTDDSIFGTTLTNVTIDSNTFTDNYGTTGTTGLEAAISLESATAGKQTNIRITNNTMSGNGKGLLAFNASNLVIQGNSITTAQDQYSGTLRFEGNVQNVTIKYNNIDDNTGPGIAVDSKATSGTNSGFVVNFNNFHGNNAAYPVPISVVYDQTVYSGPLDARNNWWGNATGPSGDGTGTGDGASAGLFQPGTGLGWKLVPGGTLLYSPWSTSPNAPPGVLPTAPIAVSAAGSGLTQVTVAWTDTAGDMESGFIVQRSTDGTTFTQVGSTGFGITRFIDTSAAAGTNYSYRVAAINSNGSSPFSPVVTAGTPAAGSTVSNLSTMNWVSAISGWGTVQKDLSIAGNPLKIGSVSYARGLGTHAVSQVVYNLAGQYSNFMADIGIDAEEDTKGVGEVIFQVIGDGKVLYDSGIVFGQLQPIPISVNIAGVSTLTLVANSGIPGNIDFDHADWAGAMLVAPPVVVPPPPPATPAAPTNLAAVANSGTQVTLTWASSSPDVTGFVIQRSTDATNFTTIATTTTTATTYLDSSVAGSTGYTYRVAANNAAGSSPFSAVATVTTPAVPVVPAVPTGLIATATSPTQVNLSWTSTGTDITGFVIQRSTDGVNFTPLAISTTPATTYADSSVTASTAYSYRVAVVNAVGPSAFSAVATVTTPAAPTLPPVPTGLIATAPSPTQVSLAWTSSGTDVTGFAIQRSTDGTTFTTLTTTTTTATTYSDSTVAASTPYTYRVAAVNAVGTSAFSAIATVTTPAVPTVPVAPTGLTAIATSATQVTLAWSSTGTDVTGFVIQRSTDGVNFTTLASTTTPATTYIDGTATASTAYTYRLAAKNAVGTSAFSTTASVTTPAALPNAPTSFVATASSPTQVDLSWSATGTNATGFVIERSSNGTSFTQIGTTTALTAYSDKTVAAGLTYYYRVASTNAAGTSGYSTVATVTTPAATLVPTNLSSLPWVSATSGWNSVQKDKSVAGNPLTLNGVTYSTGLGTHAVSNIVYNVGGLYTRFQSDIGVDGAEKTKGGSIIFRVIGDGKTLFDSGILTNLSATVKVDVDISGVQSLTLVATNGIANNIDYDHADWAGAKLLSNGPIAPAAPSGLVAVTSSATQVNLRWTNNAVNATGFVIQRATGTGGFTQVGTAPAGTTTFFDKTAVAGTTYTYQVLATNGTTSSVPSATASATTLAATAVTTNLSTLTWTSATTGYGTIQKNKSIAGNTLTLRGTTYATGIGTHAASQIVYNLAGKYKNFLSDIGVDDEENGKGIGSVDFQIIGDGKILFDSGVLTNNSPLVSLNIDVTGVQTLTLKATNGIANNIDYDHADWAGAKLIS